MNISTLTNTGQATIPKDIINFLRVKAGDQLDFLIENDCVVLRPKKIDIHELKGILKSKTTVSIEEMNTAIIQGVTSE